tara:strand:+ start:241 stop:447 length:207 start_codon:yes stop_codon:yes gene_type:complete
MCPNFYNYEYSTLEPIDITGRYWELCQVKNLLFDEEKMISDLIFTEDLMFRGMPYNPPELYKQIFFSI